MYTLKIHLEATTEYQLIKSLEIELDETRRAIEYKILPYTVESFGGGRYHKLEIKET